jgi:hypothetical protein
MSDAYVVNCTVSYIVTKAEDSTDAEDRAFDLLETDIKEGRIRAKDFAYLAEDNPRKEQSSIECVEEEDFVS